MQPYKPQTTILPWTIHGIEDDLNALVSRYDPEHPFVRSLPVGANNQMIVITNPLGVAGITAVVQSIGMSETGKTPIQKPKSFFGDPINANSFVTRRMNCCVGMCLMTPIQPKNRLNRSTRERETVLLPERHCCAECGQEEAHHYCFGCHCWFHVNPRYLVATEPRLIAIHSGKRDCNGSDVYRYVKNNCANKWHASSRVQMMEGVV